jgi:hypothetical protein
MRPDGGITLGCAQEGKSALHRLLPKPMLKTKKFRGSDQPKKFKKLTS